MDYVDHEENDEPSINEPSQNSRGRQKLPEMWTRVFSVGSFGAVNQRTFEINKDLLMVAGFSKEPCRGTKDVWAPVFSPIEFVERNK